MTSVVRQSLNTLTGTRTESLMLHFNRSDSVLQNRTSNNTSTSMFSGASSKEASNQDFLGQRNKFTPSPLFKLFEQTCYRILLGEIGNPATKAPATSFIQLFVVSCWVVEKGRLDDLFTKHAVDLRNVIIVGSRQCFTHAFARHAVQSG